MSFVPVPVSQLPVAQSVSTADTLVISQNGVTKQATAGQFPGITPTGVVPGNYGDASHVPAITLNAQGQATEASTISSSNLLVTPTGSTTARTLAAALGYLYDDSGLRVSAPLRMGARFTANYTPAYDQASSTLASLLSLELGNVAVPSAKQYDVIRVTGTNTGDGKLFAYHFDLIGSNANTEPVRGVIGRVTVSGSGPGKAIRVGASGSGTSTAHLVALSGDVFPVATTPSANCIEMGNFGEAGTDDIVTGAEFFSLNGSRWKNGIVFEQGNEFKDAVFQASMDSGSATSAKFLKLKNGAGTSILFEVDKIGSVLSTVDLHAGSSRTNSVKVTQTSVERTASGGVLEIKSGSASTLYLTGGTDIVLAAGATNLASMTTSGLSFLQNQYNISFPNSSTTYQIQAINTGNYLRVLAGGSGDVLRLYASGLVTEPQGDLRLLSGKQITVSGGPTIVDANGLLGLRSYTVATLPSAATAARMLYVSDGTSNKRLAVSDGTNWRFPDGNIVS